MKHINIAEKPDWVSWDEIHNVLWRAHEENRSKGVVMDNNSLPGDIIREIIGKDGKLFVALDGDIVVGTLALIKKNGEKWYCSGYYGHLCFGAVLSEYSGKGIYRSLYQLAEKTATQMGLTVLTRSTHEHNDRMLKITKQEGYYYVDCKAYKNRFNIVRAKWLNGCPFSEMYIKMRFLASKIYNRIRYRIDKKKGVVRRFGI